MPVSKEDVLATAALCRLDMSVLSAHALKETPEERVTRIATQLDAVVGYIDIMDQVNTEDVQPLYSPTHYTAPPRQDVIEQHLTAEEVLANAPERRQTFFSVPPAIG